MKSYTQIDDFFSCDDCGASGLKKEAIKHYAGCNDSESRWQEYYYNQPDDKPSKN